MLRSLKDLEGYTVSATDGDVGTAVNFLLDDEGWVVRYLVVQTDGFLNRRQVLISPIFFRHADWLRQRFHLAMTMQKVKDGPSVESDAPVSRKQERDYYRYYGYPYYWGASGPWGAGPLPALLAAGSWRETPADDPEKPGDVHLRSAKELRGYHVQGSDDGVGHVEDFIVDDETWEIRYLVIDTRNWWFGKKVLVAPQWASRVSWGDRKVFVDLSRQAIKESPEWNPTDAINREYETRLYDYYGRPVYWPAGNGPNQPEGTSNL